MTDKRPKAKGPAFCVYCNQPVNPDIDEFAITKRKQVRYFHKNCYYIYSKIGFKPVEVKLEEDND